MTFSAGMYKNGNRNRQLKLPVPSSDLSWITIKDQMNKQTNKQTNKLKKTNKQQKNEHRVLISRCARTCNGHLSSLAYQFLISSCNPNNHQHIDEFSQSRCCYSIIQLKLFWRFYWFLLTINWGTNAKVTPLTFLSFLYYMKQDFMLSCICSVTDNRRR